MDYNYDYTLPTDSKRASCESLDLATNMTYDTGPRDTPPAVPDAFQYPLFQRYPETETTADGDGNVVSLYYRFPDRPLPETPDDSGVAITYSYDQRPLLVHSYVHHINITYDAARRRPPSMTPRRICR